MRSFFFLKWCVSNNVGESENDFIYICVLKGYTLSQPKSKSHLKSSDESDCSEWIKTWEMNWDIVKWQYILDITI